MGLKSISDSSMEQQQQQHPLLSKAAMKGEEVFDAYIVLGVEQDATTSDIKKK